MFYCFKKAFSHCVIPTITLSTHTGMSTIVRTVFLSP
jgi:hypothetical protein